MIRFGKNQKKTEEERELPPTKDNDVNTSILPSSQDPEMPDIHDINTSATDRLNATSPKDLQRIQKEAGASNNTSSQTTSSPGNTGPQTMTTKTEVEKTSPSESAQDPGKTPNPLQPQQEINSPAASENVLPRVVTPEAAAPSQEPSARPPIENGQKNPLSSNTPIQGALENAEATQKEEASEESPTSFEDATKNTQEKQAFNSSYLKDFNEKGALQSTALNKQKAPQVQRTGLNKEPLPVPEQAPESLPDTEVEPSGKPWIRTYETDLRRSKEGQHSLTADQPIHTPSAIDHVLEEDGQKKDTEKKQRGWSKQNIFWILLSLLFFIGTLELVYYIFILSAPKEPILVAPSALISVDKKIAVITNPETGSFTSSLSSLATNSLPEDTLLYIIPAKTVTTETESGVRTTQRYVTPAYVFQSLRSEIPPSLVEALKGRGMFGIYGTDTGNHPFIILKTNTYEDAFSNMLSWEQSLLNEFHRWFGLETPGEFETIEKEELIIQNRTVQKLEGSESGVKLLYTFYNESTLVITNDQKTLEKLINDLSNVE